MSLDTGVKAGKVTAVCRSGVLCGLPWSITLCVSLLPGNEDVTEMLRRQRSPVPCFTVIIASRITNVVNGNKGRSIRQDVPHSQITAIKCCRQTPAMSVTTLPHSHSVYNV